MTTIPATQTASTTCRALREKVAHTAKPQMVVRRTRRMKMSSMRTRRKLSSMMTED